MALALGPVIGSIGGGSLSGIAPANPTPLQTYWLNLGQVQTSSPSRAVIHAKNLTGTKNINWNAPIPRMRWREFNSGTTFEHEFGSSLTAAGQDETLFANLPAGTWVAEISGMASSDRSYYTYEIVAAIVPIS